MDEKLTRVQYLIGEEKLKLLKTKTVLVCGVGGVGSFVAEALARSGIGKLILVDSDIIDISNLNRQLMTNKKNIGEVKVKALKQHLEMISDCKIEIINTYIDDSFVFSDVDYVADCIDTLNSKMALAVKCLALKIPFISALGSAKRLVSEGLKKTTLAKTKNDPLARNWRNLCKKKHIPLNEITVIYCDNVPQQTNIENKNGKTRKEKYPLGSLIFVVGAVGLKMAEVIFNDLSKK